MITHKNDLSSVSTRTLLDRRRRLVARLGDAELLLTGSLVEQTRRCGKAGCRCAEGEPHGPYVYFAPKTAGRGRLRYVPAALLDVVAAACVPVPRSRRCWPRFRRSTPSCWAGGNWGSR